MKVKEILTDACILLGLDAESEKLKDTNLTEQEKLADAQIKKLYNLLQLSLRELCANYLPILKSINKSTANKEISMTDVDNVIRINNVKLNDAPVKYKFVEGKIILSLDGEFEIIYSSYPKINSIEDELNFLPNFNPDVIVLGLCSYYCIANGLFEEFTKYNDRYLKKAQGLREIKMFTLPKRSWQ